MSTYNHILRKKNDQVTNTQILLSSDQEPEVLLCSPYKRATIYCENTIFEIAYFKITETKYKILIYNVNNRFCHFILLY